MSSQQTTSEIAGKMRAMQVALAEAVVRRQYEEQPGLLERYGPDGSNKCREDVGHHVRQLAQAIASNEPELFRDYVRWAADMMARHGIREADVVESLRLLGAEVEKSVAGARGVVGPFIEAAVETLATPRPTPCPAAPAPEMASLAEGYLASLLAARREEASRAVLEAVAGGASIRDIYINVFQWSQYEIGRLWQNNRISVAQEHYCTAATQLVMSQLYPQIVSTERSGRRFLAAGAAGDLHEIGIRMVSDFFEMAGWESVYLGASVPAPDLVKAVVEHQPDVLGISAAMTPHLAEAQAMIAAVRADPRCAKVKILIGGRPLALVPDLWRTLGADGSALTAQDAVDVAEALLAEGASS